MSNDLQESEPQSVTIVTFPCGFPGCDRVLANAAGRGKHRSAAHGIPGASHKAILTPVPEDQLPALIEDRPIHDAPLIGPGSLNPTAVLEFMFGDGIPTHKISDVVDWVRATDRLNI
jgi:hypothetical protein